nr:glutathione S-transferase epsilon 1 [Agrotis ipsilon]
MPIKLYQINGTATVRAVKMTAEALQLKLETQDVNLKAGEHLTPEFLEKNPAHTVPMIEEEDFTLSDSHAIITYLVWKYGNEQQSKLYPDDLRIRANITQRLFFEATVLATTTSAIVYAIYRNEQTEPTPQQIEAVKGAYETLERYLQKTKFVACDHITVADICLVASLTTSAVWVPLDDKFTKIKAWLKTLAEEDWYKKGNLPGLKQYIEFVKPIYNKVNDNI